MTNIRNIIFDFDGTLVDTAPLIVTTMRSAADEIKAVQRSDADYRATIGLRLDEIPDVLWPGDETAKKMFADTYRRKFDELKRPLAVESFAGVKTTLKWLHETGHNMAIASSRNRESLGEYLDLLGLSDYFCIVVGGDDVKEGKPSPEPVLTILEKCGWENKETLTVGDAPVDIAMGSNAGTYTCAVTYGNGKEPELMAEHPTYVISHFESLIPVIEGVSSDLISYVEYGILPFYDLFDKAHRQDHARLVIRQSLRYGRYMPALEKDMLYCIAAFHDLGLRNGREHHHIDSGTILTADNFLRDRFSPESIRIMKEAVEDHRASGKSAPRSDYGKVVADADRFIDPESIIRRTIQYGLANYPELDREGHFKRAVGHLQEKYGPEGYIRIWLPWSDNQESLRKLHDIIADRSRMTDIFNSIFEKETE